MGAAGGLEILVDAGAALGEGPSWDAAAGRLLWVDIDGRAVHRTDPSSGADEVFTLDRRVGAAVPRAAGGLVLAVEDGFAFLDPPDGALELVVPVEEDRPETRMNDGKCDPAGRMLAGTMALDERPGAGTLYRLDPDLAVTTLIRGVTVSNGLGWSPDGRVAYYVDSPTRKLSAFDYDMARGTLEHERLHASFPAGWGDPDGLTVDAEGCVWVAFWGGGRICRVGPDGELRSTLELPVSRVTSCAFGGDGLDQLYITTAQPDEGEDPEPHAGALFVARPGVTGLPTTPFAG